MTLRLSYLDTHVDVRVGPGADLTETLRFLGSHVTTEGHAFSPYSKYAVDPVRFRKRFPSAAPGLRVPVRSVLYPRIGPGPTRLTPLAPDPSALAANTESAFDGPLWHTFVPDLRDRWSESRAEILRGLSVAPAQGLTGGGDLAHLPLP
ncbi:hypothetical protein [Nocardiopsis oceani]